MNTLKVIFTGLLICAWPAIQQGQIVIDQSDMPTSGDTIRVSISSDIPVDYSLTGRDTTWDFSMLEPMNQRVDTFVNANATPIEYWLFFMPGIVSNLASPRGNSEFFPGFPISDYYTFYKNTNDGYMDAGFAFKIEGLPLPAKYDEPDRYYAFPLDTNANWASSSSVEFEFPGMFFFSSSRVRTSFVDGWGTVVTPFGTFESIRVRSDLIQQDSIYVDSLGYGFGLTRNVTEYKWMAENMGIPVLQINSDGILATATYRDSARLSSNSFEVTLGPDTTVTKGAVITLHAQASGGTPPYKYFWSTMGTSQSITVTMDTTKIFGVFAVDGLNTFAADQKVVTVVSPGIDEQRMRSLEIFPNPSFGLVNIKLPANTTSGKLSISDVTGKIILSTSMQLTEPIYQVDLSRSPAGLYHIRLLTNNQLYQGKILIVR